MKMPVAYRKIDISPCDAIVAAGSMYAMASVCYEIRQ